MFFLEIRNAAANFLHDNRTFDYEECLEWFRKKSSVFWIVMNHEREIIGYFRFRADEEIPNRGWIFLDLKVEFQGRGYAKSIYRNFAREILIPSNFQLLALRVLKSNVRAINLYKGLNFRVLATTEIDYVMEVEVNDLFREPQQI